MWAFGLLCLLSFTAALPAPQTTELAPPEGEPYTSESIASPDKEDDSGDGKEEAVLYIPDAPELEPIPVIYEIEGVELEPENKPDEKEPAEQHKEEDKKPIDPKPVESNRPTFLSNLFANLPFSWPPSFPFSLPSFTFPFSLPSIFGGGKRTIVYPSYYEYPNARYFLVK